MEELVHLTPQVETKTACKITLQTDTELNDETVYLVSEVVDHQRKCNTDGKYDG